ncbi:uncharacterized protein LOC136038903 isoform X2 [Artemia franciscana]|uniref:uncharacterized protein LOC136038903 isoform X2 n=1 Tax=Artemia franciscana TaxID=6661 RepID=UPI0032DA1EDB
MKNILKNLLSIGTCVIFYLIACEAEANPVDSLSLKEGEQSDNLVTENVNREKVRLVVGSAPSYPYQNFVLSQNPFLTSNPQNKYGILKNELSIGSNIQSQILNQPQASPVLSQLQNQLLTQSQTNPVLNQLTAPNLQQYYFISSPLAYESYPQTKPNNQVLFVPNPVTDGVSTYGSRPLAFTASDEPNPVLLCKKEKCSQVSPMFLRLFG